MPTSPIPPEKTRLLRVLRKTCLVFWFLNCTQDPLGESDIAVALQLDRETVRNHLRSLQAADLVQRLAARNGWVLTRAGRDLYAAFNAPGEARSGDVPENAENPPQHTTITTTTALNILKPLESSVAVAVVDRETSRATSAAREDARSQDQRPDKYRSDSDRARRNRTDSNYARGDRSESDRPESDRPRGDRFREARDALRDAGIFEPTASSLAKLEHVSAEYVARHALRARHEGTPSGLLVHRIRCADPAPELNDRGHLLGCACDECQRHRYRVGIPEYDEDDDDLEAEIIAEPEYAAVSAAQLEPAYAW